MSAESFKRKLTAILSADVKGYSRLMGENEAETVKTLTAYRKIMGELIQQHRGRVIDSPGDNILAEFGSVVDAVQCSVAAQNEFKARNAELPENRRMVFRIGVNLGDVIEEEGRIYGDGVNIAARLEALAEPGGICISKTAFDHIESKLPLGYQFLGEQTVKNIAKPVGAYKVLMEPRVLPVEEEKKAKEVTFWRRKSVLTGAVALLVVVIGVAVWNFYWRAAKIELASKERMAFPIPDKPSIAVLPFVNMSEDPKQEYLSDGITDQIIAGLSKIEKLFVIARNSTFTYKGNPVKVQQVAEELGVRYVLEGSVQKSGDRIRITTQLIDALKGDHLWSERYDRSMKDVFALQDEITINVVEALRIKLGATDIKRSSGKGNQNLEAFLKFAQGFDHFISFTPDAHFLASQYFQEAIDLDPKYAAPHACMSLILAQIVQQGTSKSPKESIEAATRFAEKARELDESYPMLYVALGEIERLKGQLGKAINYYERGLALDPNNIGLISMLGFATLGDGRAEEAILHFRKAIRLNPLDPTLALWGLGAVYGRTGRYEEAIPPLKQAIRSRPQMFWAHLDLAACYAGLGKEEEARAASAEVLRINPKFTVEGFAKVLPQKNKAIRERYLENLRKAGLPDKPPLSLPDKPSIAVLPFVNMSDDKSQEYFSDGLTEEIITALSKTPKLFVIARNSSFAYKGKPVNVQQVSRELGVKYVLEGSVRRSGEQLRITAQLIDATTGNHLWAERYDRSMGEIFAVQDEITLALVKAMRVTLTSGEQARLIGKGTKNLEAYLKAIEANEQFNLMNRQGSLKAKEFAREAISIDPKYAFPYAILANAHMLDAWFLFAESYEESMKLADDAAHKALSLDENDPSIQSALTNLYVMQRKQEKAIASAERSLATGPSASRSQSSMGIALYFSCRFNEAIPFFEEAIRMDPYPPGAQFRLLGSAYSAVGRHGEALKAYENAIRLNPNDIFTHLSLAALYVEIGRDEEARAEVGEVLRLHPKFSLDYFAKTLTFRDQSFVNRRIEQLKKAGLK